LSNRGGGRPEEEEGADRWAPPVGDRVREREGSGALGRVGRKLMGRRDWVGLDSFFFKTF
jgi:hypothetical protein